MKIIDHYIDTYIIKYLLFVHPIFTTISLMEAVDVTIRVLSFITTAIVTFFIVRHYIGQWDLYKLDKKIKSFTVQENEKKNDS
jgi:hypothetical protein